MSVTQVGMSRKKWVFNLVLKLLNERSRSRRCTGSAFSRLRTKQSRIHADLTSWFSSGATVLTSNLSEYYLYLYYIYLNMYRSICIFHMYVLKRSTSLSCSTRGTRVTEKRNSPTSSMRSFNIFSRWRHILFSISQFNNPNPNPKPNPKPNPNPNPNPNPEPNPNGIFEIQQSF